MLLGTRAVSSTKAHLSLILFSGGPARASRPLFLFFKWVALNCLYSFESVDGALGILNQGWAITPVENATYAYNCSKKEVPSTPKYFWRALFLFFIRTYSTIHYLVDPWARDSCNSKNPTSDASRQSDKIKSGSWGSRDCVEGEGTVRGSTEKPRHDDVLPTQCSTYLDLSSRT